MLNEEIDRGISEMVAMKRGPKFYIHAKLERFIDKISCALSQRIYSLFEDMSVWTSCEYSG